MSLKAKAASIWENLVKQYRLVLYDQESLSQTRNVIFKPLTAVLIAGGALLGTAILTWLLTFSVPAFHRGMPGLDSQLTEDYNSLQRKNNDLEREVAGLDSVLEVFKNVIGTGNKPAANPKVWGSSNPEPANPNYEDDLGSAETEVQLEPAPTPAANPAPTAAASMKTLPERKGPHILNLVPPIDGYVTKDFEPKDKPHFGIDLAAEENSLVRAVADGVVIFSEYSNTTGHVVGIWHSQSNLISFYKHNSRTFKTVGSYVFAGEAIAVIGNTGINSSGTHLHFELWYDNNPVNPADYINFN